MKAQHSNIREQGAKTLSHATLNIMTLSMKCLFVALIINDPQHKDTHYEVQPLETFPILQLPNSPWCNICYYCNSQITTVKNFIGLTWKCDSVIIKWLRGCCPLDRLKWAAAPKILWSPGLVFIKLHTNFLRRSSYKLRIIILETSYLLLINFLLSSYKLLIIILWAFNYILIKL